jgi:hypothetical protein
MNSGTVTTCQLQKRTHITWGVAANDVSSRKAIRLEQCRERVAELAWLDVAGWGEATPPED